jgi:hypothetical protein
VFCCVKCDKGLICKRFESIQYIEETCGYVYSSELYSTIVICAVHSNYYLFTYGSSVDEPRSGECGVVRDVASGLVRLAGR